MVEDEGIAILQLRRTLTQAGLKVVGAAANGREGVEVVLREKPDLVLMDIRMPVMDGIEATRQILASYSVCVVMLTAYSTDDYLQQAEKVGACGYVLKPVTATTLLAQLQTAFQKFLQEGGRSEA